MKIIKEPKDFLTEAAEAAMPKVCKPGEENPELLRIKENMRKWCKDHKKEFKSTGYSPHLGSAEGSSWV